MRKKNSFVKEMILAIFVVAIFVCGSYYFSLGQNGEYKQEVSTSTLAFDQNIASSSDPIRVVTHIQTPDSLRGIYMTSWIAGTPSLRQRLINLVDDTELNTIVIDIKDDTGKVSYEVRDPFLREIGSFEDRIGDIENLIDELHKKNIYVIGRIAVFQDPFLTKRWPEESVQTSSGNVWKDRKGLSWMDPSSERVWKYIVALAKDSYEIGFDEINFDYVRFPTDGSLDDMVFPKSGHQDKSGVIEKFFSYVDQKLRGKFPISVDLFGLVTSATDDMGIGQMLEKTLPYFDYVGPMVYPSHFQDGYNGYADPNDYPYEVIKASMGSAVARLNALKNATSTPIEISEGLSLAQLRPWLQDFDYGADYDANDVRAQIQATYDVGLNSWILWDASNQYTKSALKASE